MRHRQATSKDAGKNINAAENYSSTQYHQHSISSEDGHLPEQFNDEFVIDRDRETQETDVDHGETPRVCRRIGWLHKRKP